MDGPGFGGLTLLMKLLCCWSVDGFVVMPIEWCCDRWVVILDDQMVNGLLGHWVLVDADLGRWPIAAVHDRWRPDAADDRVATEVVLLDGMRRWIVKILAMGALLLFGF
ncbi:hypothetical protein ACLOJK_034517 [Asimina triloba]